MHGEYKVPGGKLVVVDLDIEDGVIANFRLAGDFFLEPDEAIVDIDAAVNGLPSTTSAGDIAAAVRAALPAGAQLLGFSPEAVGVAVRRSLAKAAAFTDYEWTIIPAVPLPPLVQISLDEVLTAEVGEGRRGPTLRWWEITEPVVYLGSFQSIMNEVDEENAAKFDVRVVRRISGGGAMFVEPGSAITYSLYVPADLVQGMSFQDSYAFLDGWAVEGLKALGIDAYYQPLNDITSSKGKIGGAAQKRLASGGVLHHATLSYDIDGDKLEQVLRVGKEKLSDKGVRSAAKRIDPLRSQTGMERLDIQSALESTFRSLYGGTTGELTSDELEAADSLIEKKFATREWIRRVP